MDLKHLQTQWRYIQNIIQTLDYHVCCVVVSKQREFDDIKRMYHLGARDFGESYAQELERKALRAQEEGFHDIRWHFIGALQSNKIKTIVRISDYIHSLTCIRHAHIIAAAAESYSRVIKIFLQVNIDYDSNKSGIFPKNLAICIKNIRPILNVIGLMSIGARNADNIKNFSQMLAYRKKFYFSALSMGMSNNFHEALQYNSNFIRLGSFFFSPHYGVNRTEIPSEYNT